MQIVQIDLNCCKCEFPAEGLVLKIERYAQRLTQCKDIMHRDAPTHGLLVTHFKNKVD